jgi:hypothetical protein
LQYLTEKPNAQSIHIAKSLIIQPHNPKLVKEYDFANAENQAE